MNKELLQQLNQKPIAYYPIYREITGSTTAGIMLSQLMYWFSKKDKIFKTDEDINTVTSATAQACGGGGAPPPPTPPGAH